MGADGVHIGQTDMPVPIARSLLHPGSIIGKTCNTPEHVRVAVQEGADYVGLGPVWGTRTKKVSSPAVGPRGIGEMLQMLNGTDVKAVAIGAHTHLLVSPRSLSFSNVDRFMFCSWDQRYERPPLPVGLRLLDRTSTRRRCSRQRHNGVRRPVRCIAKIVAVHPSLPPIVPAHVLPGSVVLIPCVHRRGRQERSRHHSPGRQKLFASCSSGTPFPERLAT